MRRPLAALLLGAVSLAALIPVAAGAAELPDMPFTGPRKPVIKLACDVVRHDGAPAVSCTWSTPPPRADQPTPADVTPGDASPRPDTYQLGRVGRGGRTVVYEGIGTSFVDTTVEPGQKYGYRVRAFNAGGRPVAGSRPVRVTVPGPRPDHIAVPPVVIVDPPAPVEPACREPQPGTSDSADAGCPSVEPGPKPAPAPDLAPKPEPKLEPKPAPKPEPKPEKAEPKALPAPKPQPEPKPYPHPRPKPAPEPGPEPRPAFSWMKLRCDPHRSAAGTSAEHGEKWDGFAPAGPGVNCGWRAASDLGISGYRLWRADRAEGAKQVIFEGAGALGFEDTTVSDGHSYLYMVQALDGEGQVVAQSDGVTVSFPPKADPANTFS